MLPQPFKVHFPAEASIHVQENQNVRQYEYLHFHPEMQLTLILQGSGKVYYGETVDVIRQNHLLIIPSSLVHRIALEPNKDSIQEPTRTHVVSIFFNLTELDETLFGLKEMKMVKTFFSGVKSTLRSYKPLSNLILPNFTEIGQKEGIERIFLLTQILTYLSQLSFEGSSVRSPFLTKGFSGFSYNIEPIFNYLERNYQKAIRVEEASKFLHMSKTTFYRQFQRYTRKTFSHYLTEFRISKACKLLHQTNFSISQISFEAGFKNLSNFNRQFRKVMHMTPTEYREQKLSFL